MDGVLGNRESGLKWSDGGGGGGGRGGVIKESFQNILK